MKSILLPGFILMASLFFISCNNNQSSELKENVSKSLAMEPASDPDGEQVSVTSKIQQGSVDSAPPLPTPSPAQPDWDKKIIKEGTLRLAIDDFAKFNADVHDKIRKAGGYVAQEEQNFMQKYSEMSMTIKVPVMQFEGLVNELSGMAKEVNERKISSENVTSEYVDIRARLEARKQMRIKYLEFLGKAKNMQEVLQVQEEINSIQEDIEAATQRANYLSGQSAMSTIHLTFYPFGEVPVITTPSYVSRFVDAFFRGGKAFAELFIGLVTMWPLWLIISLIILALKNRKQIKGLAGSTTTR